MDVSVQEVQHQPGELSPQIFLVFYRFFVAVKKKNHLKKKYCLVVFLFFFLMRRINFYLNTLTELTVLLGVVVMAIFPPEHTHTHIVV